MGITHTITTKEVNEMSEGIKAAAIFLMVFVSCYLCYRIGIVDGREEERRMQKRIKAIQFDLQHKRQATR
jgi:hypothetical protein